MIRHPPLATDRSTFGFGRRPICLFFYLLPTYVLLLSLSPRKKTRIFPLKSWENNAKVFSPVSFRSLFFLRYSYDRSILPFLQAIARRGSRDGGGRRKERRFPVFLLLLLFFAPPPPLWCGGGGVRGRPLFSFPFLSSFSLRQFIRETPQTTRYAIRQAFHFLQV